jgi:hypothetical protein
MAILNRVLLTAEAYGRRVAVQVSTPDLDHVRSWLPHWWVDTEVEPEKVWDIPSASAAEYVIRDLELWIAEHAEDLIFVHAGVVAFEGRALLLPGRSFTGKTALTAALLRAGAVYGSDEYAVLDSDGLVHPYPRALAVRGTGLRNRVPAAEFGASTFTGGLPVAAVAVLRYEPGADLTIEPITPGVVVLRLFDNTICALTRPQAALDVLIAATTSALGVEGVRGEAEAALPRLRELIR